MSTLKPSTTQTNGSTVNSTTTPGLQNSTTPNIGIDLLGLNYKTLLIISASVPSGVALILAITLIIVVCRCCKYPRREKKEKPQKFAIGIETLEEARTRSLKGIRLEVMSELNPGNENQGYSQANDESVLSEDGGEDYVNVDIISKPEVHHDEYYQPTKIRQKPRETTDPIDRWSGWENKATDNDNNQKGYRESVLSEEDGGEDYVNVDIIETRRKPGVHSVYSEDETDQDYVNVPNVSPPKH